MLLPLPPSLVRQLADLPGRHPRPRLKDHRLLPAREDHRQDQWEEEEEARPLGLEQEGEDHREEQEVVVVDQ
jgi:hypothetical protein